MGLSIAELEKMVKEIYLGGAKKASAFSSKLRMRVAEDIGSARNMKSEGLIPYADFNELLALHEIFHEINHAMRLYQWENKGKLAKKFWNKYDKYGKDYGKRYFQEEIRVETAALKRSSTLGRMLNLELQSCLSKVT